jgi:hypothetical protein
VQETTEPSKRTPSGARGRFLEDGARTLSNVDKKYEFRTALALSDVDATEGKMQHKIVANKPIASSVASGSSLIRNSDPNPAVVYYNNGSAPKGAYTLES